MTRPLSILLLAFSASVTSLHCTEPTRLCYSAPVGTAVKYEATSTLGQSLTVMGREVISEVTTKLGLTVTVKERIMQRCSLQIAWSDGQLTTRTIGNEQDSHTDSTMRVPTFGLTQEILLAPNGIEISKQTTSETPQQAEVLAMIRATKIPEHLFITLPSSSVVPGFRWTQAIADTSAAPQGRGSVVTSGTATYTYRGVTDTLGKKCWVIEIASSDLTQRGTLYGAAIAMRIDGSGSMHGVSLLEARTGLLLQSQSQLQTQVVMASTDQNNANIVVPVHSQVNVVINRVESKGW